MPGRAAGNAVLRAAAQNLALSILAPHRDFVGNFFAKAYWLTAWSNDCKNSIV
jgi:hypothetical protein